jgi:hypothetical protein
MNELIIVEQLPIIKQRLEELKKEIEEKTNVANSLICNEDTIKEVKKTRTELKKQFDELEAQRKHVKNAILTPYNEFEAIYKESVSDLFKACDATLKSKIDDVEGQLKKEKEDEVREYFEEYKECLNIDFINFENASIKIGLSNSMKSLKEQAKSFIDGIKSDLDLIDTQDNKEEILVEYKTSLNAHEAIKKVQERMEAIKHEKALQEELKKAQEQAQERISQVNQVIVDVVEEKEEPKYKTTFTIIGTKAQLKEIKEFIKNVGVEIEQ